ncbi:hypothetical protein [Agrobacterium pusense]|uniref:hypothetical protein n=1 Tax=Agrobacterium pusense TaxID=648995 RepID=UPI001181F3B5|nr:hypothetical protein [Agrobacterium pusense]
MVEKIKRYWWLAACLWALLAFVSWHFESTCGVFFFSACLSEYWAGIRWIALLKWVSPYQALLAGIAAVVGGYFVLLSQRLQIDEARRVGVASKDASFRAALATVRSECLHVADQLGSDELHTSTKTLDFTRASFPIFADRDPRLLHITMSVTHRLEKALEEKNKGRESAFSQTKLLWYSSIGMAFAELLIQVSEKLNANEDASVSYASFDGHRLYSFLERRGQTPSVLFELGAYFSWPVEQHMEDEWRP